MSSFEEREAVRLRVRKHHLKHAEKHRTERLRTVRLGARMGKQGVWTAVEWTDEAGVPVSVFVARVDAIPDPPAGLVRSNRWLPDVGPMSRRLARALVAGRLDQIAAWAGCRLARGRRRRAVLGNYEARWLL